MAKVTKNEFIQRAKQIHGDKYDYSKVELEKMHSKVIIRCFKHGDFYQSPSSHLRGCGCRACSYEVRLANLRHIHSIKYKSKPKKEPPIKKKVFNVGINDLPKNNKNRKALNRWYAMLNRCYVKTHRFSDTYKDCSVCDEWLTFSNFKRWFDENHIEGYHLDKDILVKGNKVYSPTTCCFVPPYINTLLINRRNFRGELPIGVTKNSGGYSVTISKMNNPFYVGTYKTPEEAFFAYKEAKESYIKEVAHEYYERGEITKKVFDALMRYEVEITD